MWRELAVLSICFKNLFLMASFSPLFFYFYHVNFFSLPIVLHISAHLLHVVGACSIIYLLSEFISISYFFL
ncbi:hypothetical protein B9Z19DRAFT_1095997, partial [Tuber borchii]